MLANELERLVADTMARKCETQNLELKAAERGCPRRLYDSLSVAGTVGGCSPAFIAMVIEALADAAVKHGIPRASAYEMVSQMVAGTAKLQLATGMHPGAMKDAVCSPGGTTIRGVAELEAAGMRSAFIRAIDAIEG